MTRFHKVRTEKYAKFVEQVQIGDGTTTKKLGEVLSKSELTKLADALEEEPYKAGAVIVRQVCMKTPQLRRGARAKDTHA